VVSVIVFARWRLFQWAYFWIQCSTSADCVC